MGSYIDPLNLAFDHRGEMNYTKYPQWQNEVANMQVEHPRLLDPKWFLLISCRDDDDRDDVLLAGPTSGSLQI